MKRSALFLRVGAVVVMCASAAMAKQDKVEICHVPPDDPENAHTISVAEPAMDVHLGHGDTVGPCDDAPPADPCAGDLTCSAACTFIPDGGTPPEDGFCVAEGAECFCCSVFDFCLAAVGSECCSLDEVCVPETGCVSD